MSYLPSSFDQGDEDLQEMPFYDRMVHNCKQQPLVPIGALFTTGAVILAAKNVRSGNKQLAQKWFRWRVGLQTATLIALVAGSFIYGKSKHEQADRDELMRQKAKMREQLWIQELEFREQERMNRKKRAELARQKTKELEEETSQLQQELKQLEDKLQK